MQYWIFIADYQSSGGASSGGEENTPKKRRITGTKRIEFETTYAKASNWLIKALETMDDIGATDTIDKDDFSNDAVQKNFDTVNDLNNQIKEWRAMIRQAMTLGEKLMGDIQSEENYPPDYLNNVSEKVKQMRDQMNRVETQAPELTNQLAYKLKKAQVYQNLKDLSCVLNEFETFLSDTKTGATAAVVTLSPKNDSAEDDDKRKVVEKQIKSIAASMAQHDKSLSQLKSLANETLLHTGAVQDPGNSIKADLYAFCERWNGLEAKLSESSQLLRTSASTSTPTKSSASASSSSSSSTQIASSKSAVEAQVKLTETKKMEDDISKMKKDGVSETQISAAQTLLDKLKTHQESIEGVTLWIQEVSTFLNAEDAPFGDLVNLETQLKDSNSLLDDIKTLKSKLGAINAEGLELCSKCEEEAFKAQLQNDLESINGKWNEIERQADEQNTRLKSTFQRSEKIINSLQEVQTFISQLKKDLPENTPVKKPADLSQRTFKLLHFKDKIERKRAIFESLISLRESSELMSSPAIVAKIHQLEEDWKEKCEPVIENYKQMKVASTGNDMICWTIFTGAIHFVRDFISPQMNNRTLEMITCVWLLPFFQLEIQCRVNLDPIIQII